MTANKNQGTKMKTERISAPPTSNDDPYLPPIEDPTDPAMKQVYEMFRSFYGKVIGPVKVHSARLPISYFQFYGKINELDKSLTLSPELALLLREQVAHLNVCTFCMDAERAATIQASMDQAKFDALDAYESSPLFSDQERAALAYATELTRTHQVTPVTFARLAAHFNEREICEVVYLVASEHLNNLTNLGLNIHSDLLCDVAKKRHA